MADDQGTGHRRRLRLVIEVDLDRGGVIAKLHERLARTRRPHLVLVDVAGRLEIRFDRVRAPLTDYEVRPVVVRIQIVEQAGHTTVVATAGRRTNPRELQRFINLTAVQGATNLLGDVLGLSKARARRRRDAIAVLDHVSAALGPHAIASGQSAYRNPARED